MDNIMFIITRRGCNFCNIAKISANKINMCLPDTQQIRIIDNYEDEELGRMPIQIIQNIKKRDFDSYPYVYFYFDGIGIKIEPIFHVKLMTICMARIVEDLLIRPIYIDYKVYGG